MRTLLTIKKDGKLAYRDWSKSFTKGFISGLYLSHAQILTSAAFNMTDINNSTTRPADEDSTLKATARLFPKANMLISGPSGIGSVIAFSGSNWCNYSGKYEPVGISEQTYVPGHLIGIQIGRDATAVTPTDYGMISRVGHGNRPDSGAAALIESIAGDTGDITGSSSILKYGLMYIPHRSFLISSIKFKVWKTGNPGNVTMKILQLNQTGQNTAVEDGTVLATSNVVNSNLWLGTPGQLETFTFATPIWLHAGIPYLMAIDPMYVSAGNLTNVRYITANPRLTMRLQGVQLTTGGAIYNYSSYCGYVPVFEVYGQAYDEIEYGATDIHGLTVSDPNASFIISRIFRNNSGASIEVNECGINAVFTRYINYDSTTANAGSWKQFIAGIARDVIAPHIDVDDGETLEVTYTPSITV